LSPFRPLVPLFYSLSVRDEQSGIPFEVTAENKNPPSCGVFIPAKVLLTSVVLPFGKLTAFPW
jgi:hypothetical protein